MNDYDQRRGSRLWPSWLKVKGRDSDDEILHSPEDLLSNAEVKVN